MEEVRVISGGGNTRHKRLAAALIALLFAVGAATYAAVTLIYSESTITVNAVAPPLVWDKGADYDTAETQGYAASWNPSTNATTFTLTVKGSPEVILTIDDLLHINETGSINSFKVEIYTALSGTLTVNNMTLRFWRGASAPTGGASCDTTLDLTAAQGTQSGAIDMTAITQEKVQLVLIVADGALDTQSATVAIRIIDIT